MRTVLLKLVLAIATIVAVGYGFPLVKKDTVDAAGLFDTSIDAGWQAFWGENQKGWNSNDPGCGSSFSYASLWDLAVASRVVTMLNNNHRVDLVAEGLLKYKNSEGWYSATTNKDNDCYVDDNSQVVWVFLEAYKKTNNNDYLSSATDLMDLIRGQWVSNGGGVRWSVDGDYLASISTAEAALAAVRVFEVNTDWSLVAFALECVSWLLDNLQDPSDHLLYDGKQLPSGEVNDGKLTYSVGTTISTLVYLAKFTGSSLWVKIAVQLGKAATDSSGAFYSSTGYWNNQLCYVQLLFGGLSDLVTLGLQLPSGVNATFTSELKKQATYIADYLEVPSDPGFYVSNVFSSSKQMYSKYTSQFASSESYSPDLSAFCNGNVNGKIKRSLMDTMSASQIFYDVSQLL
ncbi:uncharacterized protein PRCAT00004878001 [Priceomyces carsonii]|uniref:uncharacterized protein n=1 Tax=Priceomyces carsonii TaxID=28549 RepID=UPI002ED939C8|nr:unnamed protein product [Priceomyces carsonii]